MKRLVLLVVAVAVSTIALSTPAAAAKCILIPDGDGHVKEFCLR